MNNTTPAPWEHVTAAELRQRRSAKWDVGPGEYGAWVAEMDFGLAPCVQQALQGLLDVGMAGYMPPGWPGELRAAVQGFLAQQQGWQVSEAHIGLTPDVVSVYETMIAELLPPGGVVVVPTPAYPPLLGIPARLGRQVVQVPGLRDAATGLFTLDIAGIEQALAQAGPGNGLLALCNPWNPVGRVLGRGELLALSQAVERAGGLVFADEIHSPLVLEPGLGFVSYATVSDAAAAHTVTALAASKGWNMPGLLCALVIVTGEELRERWQPFGKLLGHKASPWGVRASTAAFSQGLDWLEEVRGYLRGNFALLRQFLASEFPSVPVPVAQGTYLAWLDFGSLYLADGGRGGLSAVPAALLREKAGVRVNFGHTFGAEYDNCIRLNLATPRPVLAEILGRFPLALAKPLQAPTH